VISAIHKDKGGSHPAISMDKRKIINTTTPLPAPLRAGFCASFICRLRGLMFKSHLDMDAGLLLVQSRDSRIDSSIHMLFVFMDLAVVWINSDQIVVDRLLARSWKPAYFPASPARYILEVHPARLDEFHIGDHIDFIND